MNPRTVPAVASAAISTAAAIFIVVRTEVYNPAGTPWAPIAVLLLIAGHLPLVASRFAWPEPFRIPRATLANCAGLAFLVAIIAGSFVVRGNDEIFSTAVSRSSAQLGLMTAAVARVETDKPTNLYASPLDVGAYETHNTFAPGLILPFAAARNAGLDWRFASLAGLAIAGAAVVAVLLGLGRKKENAAVAIAVFLAGGSWLILRAIAPFLHWGTAMPLWAAIAIFGLAINARMALLAGVFGGILAAMNPGWLVLLPVVAALVYRCDPRSALPSLVALFAIPILAYAAFRADSIDLWTGVVGDMFREGEKAGVLSSWRYAYLHGVGDFAGARPAIYVAGFAGVCWLAWRMWRADSLETAARLFLFAAFIVVLCGPTAYFFHWMAHGILLAVLAPVAIEVGREQQSRNDNRTWLSYVPAAGGVAFLATVAIICAVRIHNGYPTSIARQPEYHQPSSEYLLTGFHVRSEDHVWGSAPFMQTGFMLDRREPGIMEIHLGTLGGDFTPDNPVVIRVNGRAKGTFRVLPGRYAYARVPVRAEDVHIGFNIVDLETRWVRSPQSLNVGPDHREVSICYLGMSYLPPGIFREVTAKK